MINNFIIIIPVYNSEKYIEKCIDSVINQKHTNYSVVVVDGGSTDNTYLILQNLKSKYNFNLIQNDKKISSPLSNFILGVDKFSLNDEDILITVDGDDFLYDNNVLSYLNEIYQNEDIWMTYGQYEPLSHSYHNYCRQVVNIRNYRIRGEWYTSHLRTIKKKLFNKIDRKDLIDHDNVYYRHCCDVSIMYPAIEMSGLKHSKFIDKILYYYNDLNPINTFRLNSYVIEEARIKNEIMNKKIYDELDKL